MRKKELENVIKDLTEWKEKVFGSGLEVKVNYNAFLGFVDRVSVNIIAGRYIFDREYEVTQSYQELFKSLKKDIVEHGWTYADFAKINLDNLTDDDLRIFSDYLKRIDGELVDTQTQIDSLLKKREDLMYGIESVRTRIEYRDVETK